MEQQYLENLKKKPLISAVREVFLEEVECELIPKASINQRSTCPTTKDQEDRLGKGHTDQMQRQGRTRNPNEF